VVTQGGGRLRSVRGRLHPRDTQTGRARLPHRLPHTTREVRYFGLPSAIQSERGRLQNRGFRDGVAESKTSAEALLGWRSLLVAA
jgi:hypothetical protein